MTAATTRTKQRKYDSRDAKRCPWCGHTIPFQWQETKGGTRYADSQMRAHIIRTHPVIAKRMGLEDVWHTLS